MGDVNSEQGWRPFRPAVDPHPTVTTAFARLARTHLASTSGDAALATALAGSLFFSLPNGEARAKVLLYLLLTMAPFAVVAPLIGPALDRIRGGRRLMVILSTLGRAGLCFVMISHIKSLLFFPEAFGVLILQKTYTVTKPALVPSTVSNDDELVEANSKLSILSGISGAVGAGPAALVYKLGGGPQGALGVAVVIYLVAAVLATRLPSKKVAAEGATVTERAELQSPSILLGASAMAMVRGIVGFLTLFLAFEFHREGVPIWKLGVVAVSSVAGSLLGAVIAPSLRRIAAKEENLLLGALVGIVIGALGAALLRGMNGAMLLAMTMGVGAAVAKLAFDSTVQRDAPDANRGRSFARFETRFQILWVIGATVAIIPMPATVGYLAILIASGLVVFMYVVGSMAARARASNVPPTGIDATAVHIEARMSALTDETKQRMRRALGSAWFRTRSRERRRHGRAGRPGGVVPEPPPPTGPPLWVPPSSDVPTTQVPPPPPPPPPSAAWTPPSHEPLSAPDAPPPPLTPPASSRPASIGPVSPPPWTLGPGNGPDDGEDWPPEPPPLDLSWSPAPPPTLDEQRRARRGGNRRP